MNFFLNLIISISIFLFVNYNSFGQNSTAKIIYGQVIDNSTKKPLENVKITFSTTWKGKKGNRVKGKITTTKKMEHSRKNYPESIIGIYLLLVKDTMNIELKM